MSPDDSLGYSLAPGEVDVAADDLLVLRGGVADRDVDDARSRKACCGCGGLGCHFGCAALALLGGCGIFAVAFGVRLCTDALT